MNFEADSKYDRQISYKYVQTTCTKADENTDCAW